MSTPLITVDPGKRGSGVAWWGADGRLLTAEYRIEPLPAGNDGWRCVCEKPRVYDKPVRIKGRLVRIDPDDLVEVAIAAGRITGQRATVYRFPAEWKGQVPKEIHHARVKARLSSAELHTLGLCLNYVTPSLRHNVLDAVALGMKELGRMDGRAALTP